MPQQRISPTRTLFMILLVLGLVAAACGNDDTGSETNGSDGDNEQPDDGDTDPPANGESAGTIGYLVAGDRNDGGFYEGQVEAVLAAGETAGYEVVVVDNVNPGAAREAFENVARQAPDLIIAGGAELAEGFMPVAEAPEYSDTTFVMVTSAPAASEHYATAGANENEAHYVGGVAMGLLLERKGADTGCIVAGPELQFVMNMDTSMRAGLEYVNPELGMLVTYTGDFEDTALAQEAVTAQINQGCEVVYPYLGGALSAVVRTGNEAGIGVVSTSIDRCDDPSADFEMGILYNPALYLEEIIAAFDAGEIVEGEQWALFGVADGVGVGAVLCDPTDEEQAVLDEVVTAISSGEIAGWLG